MGLFSIVKANKAHKLQQQGRTDEAQALYEEAFGEGLSDPRYVLAYAMLLLRKGEYAKAKDLLVKYQKAPGMTPDQRNSLLIDYAACCFRLGDLDKGVRVLEQQARKNENGLLYQTLGYLYVEKYDLKNRPDLEAMEKKEQEEAALREADEGSEEETAPEEEGSADDGSSPEEQTGEVEGKWGAPELSNKSPREEWEEGVARAEEYLNKALEYDDEDPICLDNMGQFVYRVKGDTAGAREWFEKAIAIKDTQIDTLYFLSRYDLEEGNRDAALEKLEKTLKGRFSPLNYCTKEQVEGEISRLKGE